MHDQQLVDTWSARVRELGTALPEATAEDGGSGFTLKVRGKTFAYFLVDHHADDRVGLWFKAGPGVQQELMDAEPDRFYIPPYVGHRGWTALDLEAAPVDDDEVAGIVIDAYRLVAPKRLVAQLDG